MRVDDRTDSVGVVSSGTSEAATCGDGKNDRIFLCQRYRNVAEIQRRDAIVAEGKRAQSSANGERLHAPR